MMQKRPIVTAGFSYSTLEETLEVAPRRKEMFIGIPKETAFQENRVPLTPEAVSVLINNGVEVVIEQGAGDGSFYFDSDYSEAGARIAYDKEDVFKATTIIKSAPICDEELPMLQPSQVVISPVHFPLLKQEMIEEMVRKKVIAIAFEFIKDDAGIYPVVRSMSEIAGSSAILTAAQLLSNGAHQGKGILLGGITGVPPAEVVILGAGVVGTYAARTAIGLGAAVKVYDNSIYRLMRLQDNVGHRLYTSVIEPVALARDLTTANVLIGAMKPKNGVTPMVVTEEMVQNMKSGSVVIDVSIDRGGCVETSRMTTHEKPVFRKYDVIHYCVPNIASGVSRTASRSISNVLMPILAEFNERGGAENVIVSKAGLRHGVYLYKGAITSPSIAKRFGMKYTDLDLLMATGL